MIDRHNWVQLRTLGQRYKSFNRISLARLQATEVEARVREVIDDHAARNAGFGWTVGPSSTPHDLHERLVELGVHCTGVGLGMVRETGGSRGPAWPAGLTIVAVDTTNAEVYARTTQRAWGHGDTFGDAFMAIIRRALAAQDTTFSPWLASLDGEPVATCLLRPLGDVGYFQGGSVLPAFRRHGIYQAMIDHRLDALVDAGVQWAVVWADPDGSARVCARAGFKERCRACFHEWAPPQTSLESGGEAPRKTPRTQGQEIRQDR